MVRGVPYRDKNAQLCTQAPQSLHFSRISRRTESNGVEGVKIELKNHQATNEEEGELCNRGNGNDFALAAEIRSFTRIDRIAGPFPGEDTARMTEDVGVA